MSIIYGEIKGQYAALSQTHGYLDALSGPVASLLSGKGKILFLGSGSSFSVARSAATMAQLRLLRFSMAISAGDLLLHMPSYRDALEGSAIVILSRSGETSEAVLAVRRLREEGVDFSLVTITCKAGSALSLVSDLAVEMPWAFDESVCQTRTVTCLYYACLHMVALLAGDTACHLAMRKTADRCSGYLDRYEPVFQEIACMAWTRAVVLGDAEIAGLCEEGALAFKEICQLPSNFHNLLDVRHGPMVLIGPGTLVVAALASQDPLEKDLLADVVKKGATVVAYSDFPLDLPGVRSVSFGEPLPHAVRGIPFIAICQMISFYKSFQTGANPDQPDGLTAWIAL